MFIVSRKIFASVRRGVMEIINGTFTESTIKELLMDLRELAKSAPFIGLGKSEVEPALSSCNEICDFIAHNNRDRGAFETHIRDRAELFAHAFESNDEDALLMAASTQPIYDLNLVIDGMLGLAYLYLISFDGSVNPSHFESTYSKRDEIAICLISILQDKVVFLKEGGGTAQLIALVYDQKFRLYCRVVGSKAHHFLKKNQATEGRLVIGFPVLITSFVDEDGVLISHKSDLTLNFPVGSTRLPPDPIIETYRDVNNKLRVRVVDV